MTTQTKLSNYRTAECVFHAVSTLRAALGGDWQRVLDHIATIALLYGRGGMIFTVQVWVDAFIDHATDGHDDRFTEGETFMFDADTMAPVDPAGPDVTPDLRWCWRIINCRHDAALFKKACADWRTDESAYIFTLLRVTANALLNTGRGYGLASESGA